MKKFLMILLAFVLLLALCSCDTFEDTPETEAAFDAYEASIRQSIAHKTGAITVVTNNKDTLEDTETLGVIEYSYSTDDANKVSFERKDYTNGELVASYYGDGAAAYQMDLSTDEWVDVTEESASMLEHESNYMNMLTLFRIDNNFRYSKQFFESLTMEEAEVENVNTFTQKNDAVTEMMSYTDEKELRREMASQYRSYYVNAEGNVYKIVIDTEQNVEYKGTAGTLTNLITVHIDY